MHLESVTILFVSIAFPLWSCPTPRHEHLKMQEKDRGGKVRKPGFKSELDHPVTFILSQYLQAKDEEVGLGFV